MSENSEPIFENDEFLLLLQKYERMKRGSDSIFFDVEEFEQIIDYYIDDYQFDKATEAANFGFLQHPASVEIKYKIVTIFLEQGNAKGAMEMLSDIPTWEHANSEYHFLRGTALCQSGKLHEAEKCFDYGLSLSPEDMFDALLNISIAFENARHYPLAVKYLEQAYDLQPDNLSVLYDLGYFYERLNDFESSVIYYQKYLDIDPFSENVWYNLGVVFFKLNKPEEAIEAYDYSIAINPDYASAYFNKANAWANINRFDMAIEAFTDFLEIEPENTQALCFLGDCYEQQGDYQNALKAYKKVIETDNADPEGWFGAGMIFYQENNFKEAAIYILKALEFDAKNTDYWINLGYVYEEDNRFDESIRCYRHITKISSSDIDAWIALTGLLIKIGKIDEAIKYLGEAYDLFPEDEQITIKLSICYFIKEDEPLGLHYLEMALKVNPAVIAEFEYYISVAQQSESIRTLINKYTR